MAYTLSVLVDNQELKKTSMVLLFITRVLLVPNYIKLKGSTRSILHIS